MKSIAYFLRIFDEMILKISDYCDNDNSHVNSLSGSKTKSVSGWTFDSVTAGPWNTDPKKWHKCDQASWFGWTYPGDAAISTILKGTQSLI